MRGRSPVVLAAVAGVLVSMSAFGGAAAAATPTLLPAPSAIVLQDSDDDDDSGDRSSNKRGYGDRHDKTLGEAMTGAPAGSKRNSPAPPVHRN